MPQRFSRIHIPAISHALENEAENPDSPSGTSNKATFREATTLPYSTPNWSKLLTPHIQPWTEVLCSYIAINMPRRRGDNSRIAMIELGRLPEKTR